MAREINNHVEQCDGELDRLIPMSELLAAVPYSRTSIYRMVAAGTFPAPMKIGAARIAWRVSSLHRWLSEKAEAA